MGVTAEGGLFVLDAVRHDVVRCTPDERLDNVRPGDKKTRRQKRRGLIQDPASKIQDPRSKIKSLYKTSQMTTTTTTKPKVFGYSVDPLIMIMTVGHLPRWTADCRMTTIAHRGRSHHDGALRTTIECYECTPIPKRLICLPRSEDFKFPGNKMFPTPLFPLRHSCTPLPRLQGGEKIHPEYYSPRITAHRLRTNLNPSPLSTPP